MTEQGGAPVMALGSKSNEHPELEMEQVIGNAPDVHVEAHTFLLLLFDIVFYFYFKIFLFYILLNFLGYIG